MLQLPRGTVYVYPAIPGLRAHIHEFRSDFIITASVDGHLKFWKKTATGVDFVKHYRAHMAVINGINISPDGELLATISDDMSMKVFDITNFGKQHV